MKKCYNLLMVMLMALLSVGFASCGDDDEPKSADIVGTWALDNTGYGAAVTLFQFTKDGTFYEVNKSMLNGETGVDIFQGTYTVSGNVLTITYNYLYEDEIVKCLYKVKGDKLTLTFEDDGQEVTATFTRVKDSAIEPYL
ncbi:MAG: hypothetical protein IJK93_11120 [Muribaculaceae bacterium]|nr:hypothetical protein [Muribaculaceae bacterium]